MTLFIWIVVFILSIAVLIKASDYFTQYAEKLGVILKLPAFVVGVLIVALGTSIPELATGIISAIKGGQATEFVAANVVGSNIANIFLVVGLASVLGGAVWVKRNLISVDLPILAMTTVLFIIFVMWDGMFTRYEAILSLFAFGIYVWYILTHPPDGKVETPKKEKFSMKIPLVIVLSVAAIYVGAKYTVVSVLNIADILGIGSSVLVLSVVAFGTSLPEVVVSVIAVRKKQYELALGNVFGSNIFNSLVIMGVSGLISPLIVSQTVIMVGLPFLGIATLLYVISAMDREIKNYEGAMFLLLYVTFIVSLITIR